MEELFKLLGIKPNDNKLYNLALTHPSCNSEANTKHQDSERLEFVGDSVIGFVSADLIFKLQVSNFYFQKLKEKKMKMFIQEDVQ